MQKYRTYTNVHAPLDKGFSVRYFLEHKSTMAITEKLSSICAVFRGWGGV